MSIDRTDKLRFAVRLPVVGKYLGVLMVVLAALAAAPLAAALLLGEPDAAARHAAVLGGLLVVGLPLARLAAPARLQANEAMAVVALAFVAGSLVMSYPLAAASASWLDAWFEAVSGITTTGLSLAASVEDKPAAFLFARAWLQWFGGLGIVVLSLALLMYHGAAGRQLMETAFSGEDLVSTTRVYARRILVVYAALTVAAALAGWAATGDGFVALVHAFAAVSTGGFAVYDDSLAAAGRGAAVFIGFAWLGAVSLPLYHRAWHEGPRALLRDPELRALVLATALTGFLLWLWAAPGERGWAEAAQLAMSAQSTTGFSTTNLAALDEASRLTLVGAMLLGGSVGSTAGGFKLLRLLLMLRLLQLFLARAAAPPHAVLHARLGERRVDEADLGRAALLMALIVGVVFLSWLAFGAAGYPALGALFEVASATGTVGLSSGIARPELEWWLKLVLCFDMLAGRVEILALLVVLNPGSWFGRRAERR